VANKVIPVLVEALDEEEWDRAEQAMQALAEMGPQVVSMLLPVVAAQADEVPSRRRRLRAIEVLGRIGSPESVEALRALQADGDIRLRLAAVSALARLSGAGTIDALSAFLGDQEAAVRGRTLQALRECDALAPERAASLLGDLDPEVRAIARAALQEQGRAALPIVRRVVRRLGAPARGILPRATACWEALRLLKAGLRLPQQHRKGTPQGRRRPRR
jgi:HEAT repeat protein